VSSGLNLITQGLFQASGTSLATQGLIVLSSAPTVSSFSFLSGAAILPTVDVMLEFNPELQGGDIGIENGDLRRDASLRTSVLLSLFSDRRANPEEVIRFGGDDARGWWGDGFAEVKGDQFGAKLWLLGREKVLPETLNRAREYTREALAWMVEDGVADEVLVDAAWLDDLVPRAPRGVLALGVEISKPTDVPERYALVWSGTA